jgi:hypothetical protein
MGLEPTTFCMATRAVAAAKLDFTDPFVGSKSS